MASKKSSVQAAKPFRKTRKPSTPGEEEGREAYVPPMSQEQEDLDVTQIAQNMMNAVHSTGTSHQVVLADSPSDQEET